MADSKSKSATESETERLRMEISLPEKVAEEIIKLLNKAEETNYFSDNFEKLDFIDEGGFGKVYRVRQKTNSRKDEKLAVKHIDLSEEVTSDGGSKFSTNTSDTQGFNHLILCCQEAILQSDIFQNQTILPVLRKWIQPNEKPTDDYESSKKTVIDFLQKCLTCIRNEGLLPPRTAEIEKAWANIRGMSIYLVMEYYDMSLRKWLDSTNYRNTDDAVEIIAQIVDALQYIHHDTYNYIHYDLKPANILIRYDIDGSIEAVLTDFGLCRLHGSHLDPELSNRDGTSPYNHAPEDVLTEKFDMWSFGLLVYELICPKAVTITELSKLNEEAKKTSIPELHSYIDSNSEIEGLSYYISVVVRCLRPDAKERVSSKTLYDELYPVGSQETGNSEFDEEEVA
ncbi:hypothetical protein EB796_023464 [Bugula neritina]|uniref:Protein kinase domain-containing protein n=1 Tax=Bugula neritina TaxID=10212 RepID=A0A7J7IWF2_BUGNE|nr:hypothetical protein EB796_023464 [Bugula neritina]